MATKSFDETMVIDTPEAAANLEAAFREAMERGPMKFDGPSIDELLKRGEEFIENNPDWLKRLVAKAREEAEKECPGLRGEEDLTE